MRRHTLRTSLQTKLALSYLGITLGAIMLLVIVISLAVQNYFYTVQNGQLKSSAEYAAQRIAERYHNAGDNWGDTGPLPPDYNPELFIVVDTSLQVHSASSPRFYQLSTADVPTLEQALKQALQGREAQGSLQGSSDDANTFSGFYIAVPIYDNSLSSRPVIGALLLAQPYKYPAGFSPNDVLATVYQVILITGALIAAGVIIFSIFLTRRMTRSLVSLTGAAEQMKAGNYAQRVAEPKSLDEIGMLAQTFNAMAATIESDVTELRRQEQMRREMIANIAHDLVTPLTAIQGFSEALADEVITAPAVRQETAQRIGREVQRLRRLVSDMQQMTLLESGRLDSAPLDMHSLVDEVLSVIGPECEQAGIRLRNTITPETPAVLADSDRITQVLLNLLDNARRHTPSGGTIAIGAVLEKSGLGEWLLISVSDTGAGIAPGDLPHIFERFFRSDKARTGSGGSSGLGLSIVKAIITAHGGTIKAESTPGKGTTISFTLPVAR